MRTTRILLAVTGMVAVFWATQTTPGAGATTTVGGQSVSSAVATSTTVASSSKTTTHHKKKQSKAAAATPTVTVTPDTGLTNGQTVTLTVAGFPKKQALVAIQCAPGVNPGGQNFCDIGGVQFVTTDASGAGTFPPFTVHAGPGPIGVNPGSICSVTSQNCEVIVSEPSPTSTISASALLHFGTVTTTTTSTTTTTIANGTTGNATTTTGSGGTGSSGGGGATGAKSSLANTGSPRLMWGMIGVGLTAILLGLGVVQMPRRSRRLR